MIMRLPFSAALVCLALLSGTVTVPPAAAGEQTPPTPTVTPSQPQTPTMNMMKMHEQMMAEMKANDARLEALLKDVNAAKADSRTDALIAAVNELARQYKAERAHMAEMHQTMCGQMNAQGHEPTTHAH
jgi:hypothetical protein